MDKLEYCAAIQFFVLDGLTPKEIGPKLTKVYGNSTHAMSTVKKWAAEFKRGRTSLKDDPYEERPKTATTSKNLFEFYISYYWRIIIITFHVTSSCQIEDTLKI